MCPGGQNGNQFAETCYYDDRIETVICQCELGYLGPRCDKCDSGYFGNPTEPGGSCIECNCNGNVDPNNPNRCDTKNGTCIDCLYNTYGDHCERCKPGYYGNAAEHNCRRIIYIYFI